MSADLTPRPDGDPSPGGPQSDSSWRKSLRDWASAVLFTVVWVITFAFIALFTAATIQVLTFLVHLLQIALPAPILNGD